MRREADQARIVAVSLANELADIQLALLAHFRSACVAEMRVVLPDDDFGAAEMFGECGQRFGHVLVAKIP